jgi:DNA modification methylase
MEREFELETTTVWNFSNRGDWSGHKGDYPGNWSPYVPRNIISRYSKKGDIVLDQFVGSGTTLVESALLGRRAIGCDINKKALMISKERIKGLKSNIVLLRKDATNLNSIKSSSIDLICTHPPYFNIIKYSNGIKGDLSLMNEKEFYIAIEKVSKECYRVLKNNKYCAVLMGDTRKNGYVVPLAFNVMNIFINTGFKLKEIIIKQQHNCRSTKYWG